MLRRVSGGLSIPISFHGCLILALLFALSFFNGYAQAQAPAEPTPAPQANAPANPSAVPTDTASSTYVLKPYDLIDVDVFNEADLHKPARLGEDGTILLPLIGSVKVGGLTVTQATDLITQRYSSGFVKNPSILITVLQYRKSTFSILGQVGKPGVYDIPEGADISIVEAISLTGGFTANAAQNSVTVKRTVDGKAETLQVRVADMAQNPNVAPFNVMPGDAILVSYAYQNTGFSIMGQVQKPGLYEIPLGAQMSITEALSMAGGFTATASQNDVSVKRKVNGALTILKVRARDMALDPTLVPFQVLPGDSILVNFHDSTFSILGQVNKPGSYVIEEGSHLNIVDAILLAGGYTRLAQQNGVVVKRTVDGKIVTIKVHARDMAEDSNVVPFEVLPGDIINVRENWY